MLLKNIFPFAALPQEAQPVLVDPESMNITKVFKVRTLGLNFNNGFSVAASLTHNKKRALFESPTYELDKILQAIDTDSYLKQGFWKYKELFWKEGWDITGEDPKAIEYLWQRIDLFEEIMERPFNDFLQELVDQLCKLGNAFVVEARGDIRPMFDGAIKLSNGKDPISGYYIIPTEKTQIYRDTFNNPIAYRQSLGRDFADSYNGEIELPTWDADEVIHFALDKKPGRAFGTPFIVGVLDDVIALRQIEEDIQNLVHRELSPIYKYRIGTEESPASPEELAEAAAQLESMRVEGGLIMPERHDVEVIGSEGHALEASKYLSEFKQRVVMGLGLAPHHLGMMSEGGNRSVTDRLDMALYDKIKMIQAYVEGMIRLHVFNPLLREGGFDPMVQPVGPDISSRCFMKFREIDIDTQVKLQTHYIQMFANNVNTLEETRIKLGEKSDVDRHDLLMTMTAKLAAAQQLHVATNSPRPPVTATGPQGGIKTIDPGNNPKPTHPDSVAPSAGGVPNAPNTKKALGNAVRPANQFGRRNSPNIRHFDDGELNNIVELLGDENNVNE